MAKPFSSARLIYRALDKTEDEVFFLAMLQDPLSWINVNPGIAKPQGKPDAIKYMEFLEGALLGVVICLPSTESNGKPTPIGIVCLKSSPPSMSHHRCSEIGVELLRSYQGKGYGGEAINWILDWGFETAGLHRVSLRWMGWNEAAGRLYERLGFKVEGVIREDKWWKGRWWDSMYGGMLAREWAELRERRKEEKP